MEIIGKLRNTSLREIIKILGLRIYRFDTSRKLIIPFVKLPNPKKWVFIVACCNSGTTLLTKLLGTHSNISSLPEEGVWLTNRLPRSEDYGWTRMWCRCKNKVYMDEKDLNVNVDKLKKEWGFWLDSKKDIFLEKSSLNSIRMRWLQKNFHPSYFISIVRNGYAIAEGIKRKARTDISSPIFYKPPYPYSHLKGKPRNYSKFKIRI